MKHREFKYASSPLFSSCGQSNLDFLPILPFPSSTSLYSIISVNCTRTCSLFRLLFPGCPLYFENVVIHLDCYLKYFELLPISTISIFKLNISSVHVAMWCAQTAVPMFQPAHRWVFLFKDFKCSMFKCFKCFKCFQMFQPTHR